MSDDILHQIDTTLSVVQGSMEANRRRFDVFGPDWDADRVDRWGDGMRVRPAGEGAEEGSADEGHIRHALAVHRAFIAATEPADSLQPEPEVPTEVGANAPICRGCRLPLPLQTPKLCGPCSALPPCGNERVNERTGRLMACFRPQWHDGAHEDSVTGSLWARVRHIAEEAFGADAAADEQDVTELSGQPRRLRLARRAEITETASDQCSHGYERGDHHWFGCMGVDPVTGQPVAPVDAALEPDPDEPEEVPALRRAFWRRWLGR